MNGTNFFQPISGYYFITDSSLSKAGNFSDVKNALKAGVKIVQYRNKKGSPREMFEEASAIKKLCSGKALFVINDNIDIAAAVNADGVHLGQEDAPPKIAKEILGKNKMVGVTASTLKQALKAQKQGADYIAIAPVFPTKTKKDAGKAAGLKTLSKIKKKISIPLVAIGGINLSNADEVIKAGADCICAISAVVSSKNVKSEILKFQNLFKQAN